MDKRIKLKSEEECYPMGKFTYQCTACGAFLFSTDNYCAHCGNHVSDEVVIGVVKLFSTSDDDYNKPMEEPV